MYAALSNEHSLYAAMLYFDNQDVGFFCRRESLAEQRKERFDRRTRQELVQKLLEEHEKEQAAAIDNPRCV